MAAQLTGASVREGLLSPVFLRLFIASALFTFTIVALVVHFVPILKDRGADAMTAAGVASLVGVFSIVGRLGTGVLLDRYRAAVVGAAAFLLPVVACALLLFAGANRAAQSVAAAVVGLTLGSEVDVIVYLTTRHFGLKNSARFTVACSRRFRSVRPSVPSSLPSSMTPAGATSPFSG